MWHSFYYFHLLLLIQHISELEMHSELEVLGVLWNVKIRPIPQW